MCSSPCMSAREVGLWPWGLRERCGQSSYCFPSYFLSLVSPAAPGFGYFCTSALCWGSPVARPSQHISPRTDDAIAVKLLQLGELVLASPSSCPQANKTVLAGVQLCVHTRSLCQHSCVCQGSQLFSPVTNVATSAKFWCLEPARV